MSDMVAKRHRAFGIFLLALGISLTQQTPQEAPGVTFHSQTRLVLLSFHVAHGKNHI
jgi:hypothetical protein